MYIRATSRHISSKLMVETFKRSDFVKSQMKNIDSFFSKIGSNHSSLDKFPGLVFIFKCNSVYPTAEAQP